MSESLDDEMPIVLPDYIRFWVDGIAAPGGSKNAIPIYRTVAGKRMFTRRVALRDAGGEGNRMWKDAVREAGLALKCTPLKGPLELTIVFHMMRPKSHYLWKKAKGCRAERGPVHPSSPFWHTIAPDLTKLVRSTEDALKGIVWPDDCVVVRQHAEKFYHPEPGAMITIHPIKIP